VKFSEFLMVETGEESTGWPNLMDSLSVKSLSGAFLVAMGVVLAIAASFVTCLGLNLQKKSLNALRNQGVSPWRQPKWIAGLTCIVVGSVLDFIAIGLAPQSLIAPLASLSLVWNLFIASAVLGEQWTTQDAQAVVIIVVGTAMAVCFASHDDKDYSVEDLIGLFHEVRVAKFAVYASLLLLIHGALAASSRTIENFEKIPMLPEVFKSEEVRKASSLIGHAGFAGLIGGQSLLFAKSVMSLLQAKAKGEVVFNHAATYVVVFGLVVCLLMQICFLNEALRLFDALLAIPVYQSYWIVSGTLSGLVCFGEMATFHTATILMFLVSIIVIIIGLLVLTTKAPTPPKAEEIVSRLDGYSHFPKVREEGDLFEDEADDEEGIDMPILSRSSSFESDDATSSLSSSVSSPTANSNILRV